MNMIALILASGIDAQRIVVFHQDESRIAQNSHISVLYDTCRKLKWMTLWKSLLAVSRDANDELQVDDSLLNVTLFMYPILQAADILAQMRRSLSRLTRRLNHGRATYVPVGED